MPKTILIVEDEIFVAMDIERILADAGYTVTAIAADRESALDDSVKADIAFVDVNLRDGQTGPTIASQLAARDGTRVIYVTANPAQIDPIADNAIGYIQKPFSAAAIRAAVALADGKPLSDEPGLTEIKLFNRDA